MGVASGCGEQEVGVASGSGWNLWMWLLGVVLRRYIDFLILLIPTPLVSVLFCSSIPTFLFIFKNDFRSLYIYIGRILHSSTVSVGLAQARPNNYIIFHTDLGSTNQNHCLQRSVEPLHDTLSLEDIHNWGEPERTPHLRYCCAKSSRYIILYIKNIYKNEQKSRDAAAKKYRYKRSRDK